MKPFHLSDKPSPVVIQAARNAASSPHAVVNLIRLVKSLEAKVNSEEDDGVVDSMSIKRDWENVMFAKSLLEALQNDNEQSSSTSPTLLQMGKELSNIQKSFQIRLSTPLPTPPMNPALIALPMTPNPSNPPILERKPSPPLLQSVQKLSTPLSAASVPINNGVRKRKSRIDEYLMERSKSDLTGSEKGLLPLKVLPVKPKFGGVGNVAGGREALLAGAGPGSGIGSAQLHEELGGQLADMSHRLKLNAVQFSNALENEKSILEDSQNTLENNLTATKSSKNHLSTVSSKGRSTTCLTLGVVILVMVLFVWTYMLIRFT
ncbi:uncharacterized protein I206_103919 [Kwoniella pini CBS 10737]|uniref:Uncharacterized protein n=1 Tax=Kwoniella pini CBS 10737 TaxID=1296096 RepID=A0A1B9I366_9TREE|nr:uncharacterized protein I206_04508 [Kwoniella pini CBS 10737]OCF49977.1 hypothetical protein I206_04508 [Kwoniella pini CBS 10737]